MSIVLGQLVVVSTNIAASESGARLRPNIIFILCDDLGYGDLGCYGQKVIQTPNLDAMAAEGLRFTDAYAGATVCAPSRCVLMTGRHVGHCTIRGLRPAFQPGASLVENDVTIGRVLKVAGYKTGTIGKWGLGETKSGAGLPWNFGFDYFYGYLTHGHAHNYYPAFLWRNQKQEPLRNELSQDPAHNGSVATVKAQYSHDLLTDESLQFVRDNKDGPFFLYLCFTIPHSNKALGAEGMEVPDYGDYSETDWPNPEKGKAAMITRMDADVGRLLALLKELRIDENTLVMFSSDNGPPRDEGGRQPEFNDSNGPLRGFKGQLYEGGIRVPFIARWPGHIKPGTTSSSPVMFADVMPTLANLAGGKAPADIDGIAFSPTLAGNEQPQLADRFLYWEYGKYGVYSQAARWNQWKAVRDLNKKTLELYDLASDRGETRDLAAERPEIRAKFKTYFKTARTKSKMWPMKWNEKPPEKTVQRQQHDSRAGS